MSWVTAASSVYRVCTQDGRWRRVLAHVPLDDFFEMPTAPVSATAAPLRAYVPKGLVLAPAYMPSTATAQRYKGGATEESVAHLRGASATGLPLWMTQPSTVGRR